MTGRIGAYVRTFTGFERDARIFLLTTLVSGAAISLYWTDFNLYLSALGLQTSTIGLIATCANLAAAIIAFPASGLSDRVGRRMVLVGGLATMTLATGGFIVASAALPLALLAALYGAGQQSVFVIQSPYLMEHSRAEHRSELFSLQFAITTATNIVALIIGGWLAQRIGGALGFGPESVETYRIILVIMAAAFIVAMATVGLLRDDRPDRQRDHRPSPQALGEPAAFPRRASRAGGIARLGITVVDRGRMFRLLLPGFLIALGAGQVIPFLNLFIEQKFQLDLAQLNLVFAFTSLGTVLAILLQPALARRLGKVGSVAVVQGISIPFLVVLGFSPVLWTVVIAMAVRNSLMNAGNPIANAFAMEHVHPSERATYAAASSELWSLGWVIAGLYYSVLQARLGFSAGYAIDFVTIIVLYTLGTFLYWYWFHGVEEPGRAGVPAEGVAAR